MPPKEPPQIGLLEEEQFQTDEVILEWLPQSRMPPKEPQQIGLPEDMHSQTDAVRLEWLPPSRMLSKEPPNVSKAVENIYISDDSEWGKQDRNYQDVKSSEVDLNQKPSDENSNRIPSATHPEWNETEKSQPKEDLDLTLRL